MLFRSARGHRKRIPEEESAGERFAEAGEELDRFGGLDGSDESGEDAEHASFGAVGHGAGRGWLGEEAAVGGATAEVEDARLTLEALNRSVNERATGEHAGVVDEVTRGKIVGAVEDDVVSGDECEGIIMSETGDDRRDLDQWIQSAQTGSGGFGFRNSSVGSRVENLSLEVGNIDDVGVDDSDATDAGSGEIKERGAAETTRTDDEDGAAFQFFLRLGAEAGERKVALVAEKLVGRPRHPPTVAKRCEIRKNSDHDACSIRLVRLHNSSADRSKKHANTARLLLNSIV